MVIPIHHTETVPVMNCGEGYVFTKTLDGGGWTCMTKEEYEIQQDIIYDNFISALGWIMAVVALGIALIIYLFTRD